MKAIRTTISVLMLSCGLAASEQKTHASDFGDPRFQGSRDFDFRTLMTMEPRATLKSLGSLRTTFLYPDRGWPERPEMVDASCYWAARNPQLAAYFQDRVETRPVLFENFTERRALESAAVFPAEWAIRFYARVIMDDRPMVSTELDLSNPKDLEEWFLRTMPEVIPVDDATLARSALLRMKLHNGPPLLEKTGMTDAQYNAATKASAREWIARNQRRFAEIATATWGDRAVLNADIGLGPDNLPVTQSDISAPDQRPSKVLNRAGGSDTRQTDTELVSRTFRLNPLLIASSILAVALALVTRAHVKRSSVR